MIIFMVLAYCIRQHCLLLQGAREHVCDICSEAFTHKETLKKHILTHDSVMRSDPCPFCGKVNIKIKFLWRDS